MHRKIIVVYRQVASAYMFTVLYSSYTIPPVRIESFKRFPLYTFPKLWNELGDHLSYQKNKITFQIALKSELLQQILL